MARVGGYSAHKTKHQDGGVDEVGVGALSGLLADDQHVLDAEVTAVAVAHALATAANDFIVASGAGTFAKKTLAETLTTLGKAAASGLASLDASSKVVQDPASGAATKEFFVPVTYTTGVMSIYLSTPIARLTAAAQVAGVAFFVPVDFSSLTSAVLILIPAATQAAADYDIYSSYAANGEGAYIHQQNNTTTTYNVTVDIIYGLNIAGILSNLVAGDHGGIRLKQGTAGHNVDVVGIRFKYS